MFSKSTLLGTLFGALAFNILGWGIYGYLTADYFESQMIIAPNDAMDPLYMSLGSVLMAFAMANLYRRFSHGLHSFGDGIYFGLWIGFFAGFGFMLLQYGAMPLMTIEGTVLDAIIALPFYGLVGGTIGWAFALGAPKGIS